MASGSVRGTERQLTRTRSRMLEKLEKKRSAGQASLQQRISRALSSSAAPTPAGGSPAGGSPMAANALGSPAAAWAQSTGASPAGGSPEGESLLANGGAPGLAKAENGTAVAAAAAAALQAGQQGAPGS